MMAQKAPLGLPTAPGERGEARAALGAVALGVRILATRERLWEGEGLRAAGRGSCMIGRGGGGAFLLKTHKKRADFCIVKTPKGHRKPRETALFLLTKRARYVKINYYYRCLYSGGQRACPRSMARQALRTTLVFICHGKSKYIHNSFFKKEKPL